MRHNLGKETWQRAKAIVEAAIDQPVEARVQFVEQAAAADAALASHVLRLLSQLDGIDGFLENGASVPPPTHYQGQRLGAYVLGAEIGRGGMGVVHLAERADGAYQQRVAVKLIAPDRFGGTTEIRRMARERQVLARLSHPNIARLLDGGSTPEGTPYLVMEFVDGKPIDRYCQERQLTTRERVALVQQVCAAVQSAHQQLLIHRDIKPGNVLVTDVGVPKLLDFGIARLISPEADASPTADATQAAQQMFTPRYASPEQAKGEVATIATDVYGLGLLLYDLLAGTSPYERVATAPETTLALAVDVLLRDEPRLASVAAQSAQGRGAAVARDLRDDLESVLAKAIAKNPAERYATVAEFAADLAAWGGGLPVRAVRQSRWYVFKRFAARHQFATSLAASAIIVMTALTAWALVEQSRAQRQASQTRQLASKLVFEYYKEVEPLPGAIAVRKRMLEDASQYLDKIVADAPGDVDVAVEAGAGFRKLADALFNGRGTSHLGDKAGAIKANERAKSLLQSALARSPKHRQGNLEMGKFEIDLASFEFENGKVEDAEKLYNAGIDRLKQLLQREPNDGEAAYEVTRGYGAYASMQVQRKISALPLLAKADEAMATLRRVTTDATAIGNAEMLLVSTKGNDATQRSDHDAAVRYAEERIVLLHRLEKQRAEDANLKRHLLTAYSGKGTILINAKRPQEALAPLAEAIRRQSEYLAANPKDVGNLGTMGRVYFVRARAYLDLGDPTHALADYIEATRHFERTEGVDLPPPLRRMHAQSLAAMARNAKELQRREVYADAVVRTRKHAARYPQVYEAEALKTWLSEAAAASVK